MKRLICLLSILISSVSMAHFKLGLYKGQNLDGATCSLSFVNKVFNYGIKSPFNEKVKVYYANKNIYFDLKHPFSINSASEFSFTHSILKSAKSLMVNGEKYHYLMRVNMGHGGPKEGPQNFIFLKLSSKGEIIESEECLNLTI